LPESPSIRVIELDTRNATKNATFGRDKIRSA
jgi:hypothetical protein